jgi:hypothetical protein
VLRHPSAEVEQVAVVVRIPGSEVVDEELCPWPDLPPLSFEDRFTRLFERLTRLRRNRPPHGFAGDSANPAGEGRGEKLLREHVGHAAGPVGVEVVGEHGSAAGLQRPPDGPDRVVAAKADEDGTDVICLA